MELQAMYYLLENELLSQTEYFLGDPPSNNSRVNIEYLKYMNHEIPFECNGLRGIK